MLKIKRNFHATGLTVIALAAGFVTLYVDCAPALAQTATTVSASDQENALASMIMKSPDQKRRFMRINPILARVARQRAEDMARRAYFSHTNPDGFGPNYLVQKAGYVLPEFYGTKPDGNFIESIAAGGATAADTFKQWLGSPLHRRHMLAEIPFNADQTEYGIGYAYVKGSPHTHYWVLITAPPASGSSVASTTPASPVISVDAQENGLAALIVRSPGQRRRSMRINPILARVARQRAEDMARRRYITAVDPDGFGLNYLVRKAGYVLPASYSQQPDGNSISSFAYGRATAADALQIFLKTPGMRNFVLGETPFYAAQTDYGIGYANVKGSPHTHYWVLITAQPGP